MVFFNRGTTVIVANNSGAVKSMLDSFARLATAPPSLFVALEGIKLCRYGTIPTLTIFAPPRNSMFLVDIHVQSRDAFTATATDGTTTLKSLFESATIPKVFFDVRNDSDALLAHYGIVLSGIVDLQLMELATRRNCGIYANRSFITGLAKCIDFDLPDFPSAAKATWQQSKADTTRLFDPMKGGSYDVFNQRPMLEEIKRYCAQDVMLLPDLYKVYDAKLTASPLKFWRVEIEKATAARVALAMSSRSVHLSTKGKSSIDLETADHPYQLRSAGEVQNSRTVDVAVPPSSAAYIGVVSRREAKRYDQELFCTN